MSLSKDFSCGSDKALAAIFSLSGTVLTDVERSIFQQANPFGFILFKRNCDNPEQLKALINDLKDLVGRDCPVLIDQEGGRVQRLRPPHWRDFPTMKHFGDLYEQDKQKALEELRFETLRLAEELVDIGVNVNCAPVLDLMFDGAHDIIGDRAFSSDPKIVARLGLSVCRHYLSAGITPIIKHIPGHGRAFADSHLELPYVDAAYEELSTLDFAPFKALSQSDVGHAVWAMTAHILYKEIDGDLPVSVSEQAVQETIRQDIGFDGILIGDDLDMKALDSYGSAAEKAMKSLGAGCDLALYCAGEAEKMDELAENLPILSDKTLDRLKNAVFSSEERV
ncbi:MAG: beta-N-acetylhexosaminidase [Alphaproteobacteria bacterium]